MKQNRLSVTLLSLSAFVLCISRVACVMAATPTAVIILMCGDYGSWPVVFYDHSSGAPAQTAGASCPAQLATLMGAGFINVNVTVQTYASISGQVIGAPGGVNGTYSTYVLTNGAIISGNL